MPSEDVERTPLSFALKEDRAVVNAIMAAYGYYSPKAKVKNQRIIRAIEAYNKIMKD